MRIDHPWGMGIAALAVALGLGILASRPTPLAYVVAAQTRAFTAELVCPDQPLVWRLDRARYWTEGLPDDGPDWPMASGRLMLHAGAVVEARLGPEGDTLLAVRPSARPGLAEGAFAELLPNDGNPVEASGALFLRLPAGTEPQALPVRGIVRVGGTVAEGAAGSEILEAATIIARGKPMLARETRTFLEERVAPGSLVFSHPELMAGAGQSAPAGGWEPWCAGAGGQPGHAIGMLHMQKDRPMRLSFVRHGDAVGLQTLGSVVPDDGAMVELSVTRWARWIAAAWVQTALVILAGALAVLNYLYQSDHKPLLRKRSG